MTEDYGTHTFIGTAQCGCIVAFVLDIPGERPDTMESVAEFLDMGMTVERMKNDDPRIMIGMSGHKADCPKRKVDLPC